MTGGQWDRVSSVWHAVLARPEAERGAALDELCAGDGALRHEVESLLAHLAGANAAGFGTPSARGTSIDIPRGAAFGPYQVLNQIGAGGMGVVYRARDPRLKRDVAIKVLPTDAAGDSERLRRFEQEARSAAALNHPNIVAVYDIGQHERSPYIVSELLDGATLRERLSEARSGLPLRKALDYAVQIARGLAAAHEKGIVHRDLKPENVFVTADGHAKILDFGLAKLTEGNRPASGGNTAPARSSDTQPGMVLGTVGYMAPEQVRGLPADARADIFAFGASLYEMLCGRRAFRGETAMDTLSAILTVEPPPLSSVEDPVPPLLGLIVSRCLEKSPAARFQTATDLAFALEALSGSNLTISAVDRTSARRGLALGLAAGMGMAALVAVGILVAGGPQTPPRSAEPDVETSPSTGEPVGPSPSAQSSAPTPRDPEPVSLSFPRPAGTHFTNTGRQVITITPDGKRVVFVANGTLWMRNSDSNEEARRIEGVPETGLTSPFASPDGRRVGYFQGGALWTVALDGGPPQQVCEAGSNWGASWGADGRIVFALQDGVYTVPARGGTPRRVLEVAPPQHVYGPQLLPDGDQLLMTITTGTNPGRWNEAQIVVESLKSHRRRVLIERGRDARYLATGHLVYAVGGTLHAVAFDASTVSVGDQPVAIEAGVRGTAAITAASFFAVSQTGHLVYVPTLQDRPANSMVLTDLNGNQKPLPFELVASRPRFSPDGSEFVATARDDERGEDLWVYSMDGSRRPWKVPGSTGAGAAVWARDGAITFSVGNQLIRVPDGGKGMPETLPTIAGLPIGYSPDGETLYYGSQQLWAWRRGEERKPLLEQGERVKGGASLSPDGNWLAYWTNREDNARTTTYILSTANPRFRQEIGHGHHPLWHPDGRHVFFIASGTSRLVMVEVRTTPSFSVGTSRTILEWVAQETNHPGRNYDVRPDGRLIVELLEERFEPTSSLIHVVLNWTTKLKRKVPARP
jgi:serine/threonine protein kinase/Tol biopolymer transport system component